MASLLWVGVTLCFLQVISANTCPPQNSCWVFSSFETGSEGWVANPALSVVSVGKSCSNPIARPPTSVSQALKVSVPSSSPTYFKAPPSFAGVQSRLYNSYIIFETDSVLDNQTAKPQWANTTDDIIIRGFKKELVKDIPSPFGRGLREIRVKVDASSGWRVRLAGESNFAGLVASEADIHEVLGYVTCVLIGATAVTNGPHTTYLDNVKFCEGLAPFAGCPGSCSGHGSCSQGRCACDFGWEGPDCATRSPCKIGRFPVGYLSDWKPRNLVLLVLDEFASPVSGSVVSVAGVPTTQLSDSNGRTYWTLPSGNYSANATFNGYQTALASNVVLESCFCQPITVSIPLVPLPSLLIINIVDNQDIPVSGASLSVHGVAGVFTITDAASTLSFNISDFGLYSATAAAAGYSDGSGSAVVGRNAVVVITLVLVPLPNTVRVTVLNRRNNAPISALVSLRFSNTTSVSSSSTNGAGKVEFLGLGSGVYVAFASASGYGNGSATSSFLRRADVAELLILLDEIPCVVQVLVISNQTSLPIPNATVTLNTSPQASVSTTGANGMTSFSIFFDAATTVSGSSLPDFTDNTVSFAGQCGRGLNISVTVPLFEVLTLRIAARDAQSANRPYLRNAVIRWNGDILPVDPTNNIYRFVVVPSLPVTGTVVASDTGFNSKTSVVTFNYTVRYQEVSLAPQQFTVWFSPVEILPTGPSNIPADGILLNSLYVADFPDVLSTVHYVPTPVTVGGLVTRQQTAQDSRAYFTNVVVPSLSGNFTRMAARFDNAAPTSGINPFLVLPRNLDTYLSNFNSTDKAKGFINITVPGFAETPERNLLFTLPYTVNVGFVNVRVWSVAFSTFRLSPISSNDFLTCTLTSSSPHLTNYPDLNGALGAVFEYGLTFGDNVLDITFGYPTESYDPLRSNWVDEESSDAANGIYRPYPANQQPSTSTNFIFPSNRMLTAFSVNAAGQTVRNPAVRLYETRTFVLVKLARKKKSELPEEDSP